jgi:small conductance mechanosensitive channel
MSRLLTLEFWTRIWREEDLHLFVNRCLRATAIVILFFVLRRVLARLFDAALTRMVARHEQAMEDDRAGRLRTLQTLVHSVTRYLLVFVAVVMLLQAFDVDVTGLLTTAGIGGVALGLGAQKLFRDLIAGFFLIVENQYAVGEYVTVGTSVTTTGVASGVIEELGMRITRIRDDSGRLWTLSNGDIVTTINHSRAAVEAFVEIEVPLDIDLDDVRKAVGSAAERLMLSEPGSLLSAPKVLGVAGISAGSATIRIAVAADPKRLSQEQPRVRAAILTALRETGILGREPNG